VVVIEEHADRRDPAAGLHRFAQRRDHPFPILDTGVLP
jgi:hypothetical protein